MDLLENCPDCFPFTLSEFPETIVIEGSLPVGDYYFKFTDKFQNSYVTKLISVGVDGIATIEVTPADPLNNSFIDPQPSAAWFNKNAGKFYIEASLTTDVWTPEDLIFTSDPYGTYTCIVVEFVNDDSEKNTIL